MFTLGLTPSGLEMILLSSAPIRQRYWISLTAFGLGLSHLCFQLRCSCAMTFLSEGAYCLLCCYCVRVFCVSLCSPTIRYMQSFSFVLLVRTTCMCVSLQVMQHIPDAGFTLFCSSTVGVSNEQRSVTISQQKQ